MRVVVVGCGNMAGAMVDRWIATGTVSDILIVNRGDRPVPGDARQARAIPDDEHFDVAMLGIKPHQLGEVARTHGERLARVPVLLSILAGVDETALAEAITGPVPISAMPNLPVGFGEGVVALHAPGAPSSARQVVDALMRPLGLFRWYDDPRTYRVASALSGTCPAFLFRFVDALAAAGSASGLDAADAAAIALATVAGAAHQLTADGRAPAALADAVASPGGMTRAGLDVIDDGRALNALMTEVLAAVLARGDQMATERRG